MTTNQYDDWVQFHVETLGFPGDCVPREPESWAAILSNRWLPIFQEHGYTPEELMAATRALVVSTKPPAFIAQHLAGINEEVSKGRAVIRPSEPRPTEDKGTCTTCQGSGFVEVPHLDSIVEGRWEPMKPYNRQMTFAVLCSCPLGNWTANRQGERKTLTLTRYADLNPFWREQLELRARLRQELRQYPLPTGALAVALQQVDNARPPVGGNGHIENN